MAFLTPTGSGEAQVLANYVRNQIAQVRSTVHGLTDEQVHERSTVSDFTLGALLDHVGLVVEQYGRGIEAGRDGVEMDYSEGDYVDVAGYPLQRIMDEFDARVATVHRLLDQVEAGELALDVHVAVPPAPWFPPDLTFWETRWVLLHLATESARHAGHADIIRESIDGKGAYELNALADGEQWGDWST